MPRRPQDADESREIALHLGKRVRVVRKDRGWTQSQLSDLLGISTEAYGRIERGHALPSFPTFLRLCRILECTPDTLLVDYEQPARETGASQNGNLERLARDLRTLDGREIAAVQHVVEVMLRRGGRGLPTA